MKEIFSRGKLLRGLATTSLALLLVVGSAQAAVTVTTTTVSSSAALTLTGAAASTWSTSSGALTVTGTGGLTLDSATTTAVNLGTAAAAKTITVGNAASTESEINGLLVDINAGATGLTMDVLTGGALSIDVAAAGIEVASANNISVAASDSATTVAQTLVMELTGAEDDEDDFTIRAVGTNGDLLLTSGDDLLIDTVGLLELNSSAGVISIGNDAVNQNIALGTAGTRTITVGSATTILNATGADGGLVNLSAATNTTTAVVNKGLIIPISADCAAGVTEGQICWDSDDDTLYIGDANGAPSAVSPSTGSANIWTGVNTFQDNEIFTFAGDEDIAITSDLTAGVNIINITATPGASDFATQGIKIDQAASANTNGLDAAIEIDNSDDSAAITAGLLFTSAGGAITTAVDASATGVGTALKVDANDIVGTTGLINYTNFDVNAAGGITVAAAEGLDTNAAGALEIGFATATSVVIGNATTTAITLDTDDTGDGTDVVLPNQSIGTAEILNDTITFANISDSSAVDADTTFTAADGITLTLTPTHTSGDANFLTIDANQTDDETATDDFDALRLDLTSESDDAGDTFDGLVITWENGTVNTIMDSAIKINNAETTAGTMTDAIIITSSGVAAGVTDALDVSADNITNAINVGPNIILGTTAVINFDGFDVAATTGATVIAGNAEGTAALTLTFGDILISDGDIHVDAGDAAFDEDVTVGGTLEVTGLMTANGGIVQDYSSSALADAASVAGLNVIKLPAENVNLASLTSGVAGQVITLIFSDAVVVTDNDVADANSINLAGAGSNFTSSQYDTLTLVSDGTSWYETDRSVN